MRLTEPGGAVTTFDHDDAGRRTAVNYPNGVSQTLSYEPSGRVKTITATKGTATLAGFSYTYTAADGSATELTRTVIRRGGQRHHLRLRRAQPPGPGHHQEPGGGHHR